MKTIQEIAKELSNQRSNTRTQKETANDKQEFYNGLASFLTDLGDYIVDELKRDNRVEITNFPKEYKVKVTNLRGIFGLLESISQSLKSIDSNENLSKNCPLSTVYKKVGNKKVISYQEFKSNGKTYRRTYSYDDEGDEVLRTDWKRIVN